MCDKYNINLYGEIFGKSKLPEIIKACEDFTENYARGEELKTYLKGQTFTNDKEANDA